MTDFVMPSLGADMDAGTLVAWLKHPGDAVRRGDIIAEVDTDKGVIEVEVFDSGVVDQLLVEPGTKVPVGTPLAVIASAAPAAPDRQPQEIAKPAPPPAPTPPAVEVPPPAVAWTPTAAPRKVEGLPLAARARELARALVAFAAELAPAQDTVGALDAPATTATAAPSRLRISPAARHLARELSVDASSVTGTGPGGAITRDDIQRAATPRTRPDGERMRQAIAAAMARSKREIPHYYVAHDVDVARMSSWIEAENERRSVPERLIPAVLFIKAVALALREFPELNARWQNGRAERLEAIHVGAAIALRGGGLVAPALHDTDRAELGELMSRFRDLTLRARAGGLKSSELSDSTITVTSLGDRGVETVFGIVFPPQVAIVGVGRITTRPWVVDGQIVPRSIATLTLSADHRVSDGHRGALFLAAVDRLLQEPEKL